MHLEGLNLHFRVGDAQGADQYLPRRVGHTLLSLVFQVEDLSSVLHVEHALRIDNRRLIGDPGHPSVMRAGVRR